MITSPMFQWLQEKTHLERSVDHKFAYPVQRLAEISPELEAWLAGQLLPGEALREIIVAPRQRYNLTCQERWLGLLALFTWRVSPDCILALTSQRLLLVTISSLLEPPALLAVPVEQLISLEVGKILLFSWLEWAWTDRSTARRQRVYFNTSSEEPFDHLVASLSRAMTAGAPKLDPTAASHIEAFSTLPFKFHVQARSLLPPGEQALAYYFRPSIRRRKWGLISQKEAGAELLIFSNRFLILVSESQSGWEPSYGMISRWIPRSMVHPPRFLKQNNRAWISLFFQNGGASDELRLRIMPGSQVRLHQIICDWLVVS